MNCWIWICTVTFFWIQVVVRTQDRNDNDGGGQRGRGGQPKPPTVPGQGDGLPFRPGGGYNGPGAGPGATYGFNSYKGPTNGDFDSSIRKFSKAHTLGSFGSSFEGNGDHAAVMNKVYGRLKNNGAGHYNRERRSNDENYDGNNSNNNRNYDHSNRGNSPSRRYPQRGRNYNRQVKRQYNRGNSQGNPNTYTSLDNRDSSFGSIGKDPFPNIGSFKYDKNLFPDDLFDFSKAQAEFKNSKNIPGSEYNQGRPSPRRDGRRRNSGYRQRRPSSRSYHGRAKSGYYPNSRQYGVPQYLSSQYKGGYRSGRGRGGYGGFGPGPARPIRPYINPVSDRLTSTRGGTTLLQVTNTRIPKTGEGGRFDSMVEDSGRAKAMIQITSGGSDQRNLASGGGFNYDNILEDDHSLTDVLSAVAAEIGQGNINPAALRALADRGGRSQPPARRRQNANDVGHRRDRSGAPSGMYSADTYSAGYTGGSFTSNHRPLNNRGGGQYHSLNHQGGGLGEARAGDGEWNPKEPSVSHVNGESSLVSFEDTIQNLVF